MTNESTPADEPGRRHDHDAVEMPRPTVAPLVLSVGVALVGTGLVFGVSFMIVGVVVLTVGLGIWIGQLLPGRGHMHEPLVEPPLRPVTATVGTVEHLRPGMTGYRFRLPLAVHPTSAGVKGGIIGGLVMPVPALMWGLLSGHGPWLPINLLAGMALPGLGDGSLTQLEEFSVTLFLVGAVIHVVTSVVVGLLYGVLMPMLPELPKPLAWGGLLMPILWTALTFTLMGVVNPAMKDRVDWPSFIFCQFVFGVVAALVLMAAGTLSRPAAGVLGGVVGGLVMALPAMLWGVLSGHGPWYPINLLAGAVLPDLGALPTAQLEQFNSSWFAVAAVMHATASCSFGLANGLLLPRVPPIPAPLAWGGLLLPLVWTALSYAMMGVANPILEQYVDWPWFVVCQFVYGVTAAVVVLRSEMIAVPPAGSGA